MTRDDVIRLAREAGLCTWIKVPEEESEKLERFVAIVAAAEREACAKACDELFPPPGEQMAVEWAAGTIACANAIRARGHK